MPEHILIAGYYGFGNIGDEAVLTSMLLDLRARMPKASFTVVSNNPPDTERVHKVHSLPVGSAHSILEAASISDLIVLGGGGLFSDYLGVALENIGKFDQPDQAFYLSFPLMAHLLGKPCMLYGVGLGPLEEARTREAVAGAISLSDLVTVRDQESMAIAESLAGDHSGEKGLLELTADPAFGLQPCPADEALSILGSIGLVPGSRTLGICLRPWLVAGGAHWEAEVARSIDGFLQRGDWSAVFLPFQIREGVPHENDLITAQRVRGLMRLANRTRILERRVAPEVLAGVMGQCDLILAMRMHALIFAINAGRKAIGLAYDPKVRSLMRRAQIEGWCLNPEDWNEEQVLESLIEGSLSSLPSSFDAFRSEMRLLAAKNADYAVNVSLKGPQRTTPRERLIGSAALQGFLQRGMVASLEDRLSTADSQLAKLLADRDRLEGELGDLRNTLGVRLLDVYWRLARRLFPEGGASRWAYREVNSFARNGLIRLGFKLERDPSTLLPRDAAELATLKGEGSRNGSGRFAPSPDPRVELLRFEQRVRQSGADRLFAFLSATQLIESEGQRSSQLALELARRGIPVVFCYWRWEASPWTNQEWIDKGILQLPMDIMVRFPEELFGAFAGLEKTVLFEFPHPSLFGALAVANARGWATVYDVVDDWEAFHAGGQAPWYETWMESHLTLGVDAVLAVNDVLASKIARVGRTGTDVLPNGCPARIGLIDEPRALRRGEVTVGYFGHLSDAWFDWDLVLKAARLRPSWVFYLIGYGQGKRRRRLPANVYALGKKPQSSLASFAANWDVGMVPFKPGPLARGSDPIKTYEFLAMGLPVVMTGCYPPRNGSPQGIHAEGVEEFLEGIEYAATHRKEGTQSRRDFAAESTWDRRTEALLELIAQGSQRIEEKRRLFTARK